MTEHVQAFLPFSPPYTGEAEQQAVSEALRSGWLTTGPKVREFEQALTARAHAGGALALNSCTSALHIALKALGVGPGDEVVTTPQTFVASVNVIEHVGARPVFVDVEPDTLNLDPQAAESAITDRTKVLLPVHFAGHPVDLDAFDNLASERRVSVVEDAAHAIGAAHKGRAVGSSGNPVCFSFYATKNLTTGEGGMLVGPEDFVERARTLALHGLDQQAWRRYESGGKWRYDVTEPGFKYNMPELAGAIGLAQLEKLPRMQQRRREVWDAYNAAFAKDEALQTPVERQEVESALHLYVLRLHLDKLTIDRDRFIELMTEAGIGTSVHFIPVHTFTYYREKYGYKPNDFPVAWSNFQRMFSIPLHPGLSDADVERVIGAVLDIVERHRA